MNWFYSKSYSVWIRHVMAGKGAVWQLRRVIKVNEAGPLGFEPRVFGSGGRRLNPCSATGPRTHYRIVKIKLIATLPA